MVATLSWNPKEPSRVDAQCIEVDQVTREGKYTHVLVPSVVALYRGEGWVGEGAKRLRADASARMDQNRSIFYECKNDIGSKRTYHRAPEGFRSPSEIGGHVLRFLKQAAVTDDPTPVARTVVTVPASFQI